MSLDATQTPFDQAAEANPPAVLAALKEIVGSPEFGRSERPARFLRHLVETALRGETHRLKESVLGMEVFDRPPSWDPRLDAIVRQEAARLRKRIARYYETVENQPSIRIEIPVGTYVPVFRNVAQREETAAPDRPAETPRPSPPKPSRRPLYAVAAAVLLLVGASAAALIWTHRTPAPHKVNPVAHDFVIKGRFDLQQANTEGVKRAEADFQHAIDADPNYAVAYVELAKAKLAEGSARGSTFRTEQERDSAEELSRKALRLDPKLSDAHAVLGRLVMQYEWDWSTAEREFRTALDEDPTAKAELTYASFLVFRHRFAEADEYLNRVQEKEPFDTLNMFALDQDRYLEGRFAECREIDRRLLALHPTLTEARAAIAGSYIFEGKPELALTELKKVDKSFPSLPFYQAMALGGAGQREQALQFIRPYEERYPNSGVALQWIAKVYALMGDEPNTVKWLQRSADQREWQVLTIAVNPAFASMENSAGFRALKQRMGLQ